MQLRELNGQLKAYKTPNDEIHELDSYSEFHISERVANELRKDTDFLAENHWYLVIGKYEETAPIEWEITVCNSVSGQITIQEILIMGTIEFKNEFPVLV
jgi:hypothetical protein